MNGFKKTDLYQKMKRAITHIAEEMNQPIEWVEHAQETNIFKILRLEKYEIRHGNFLEYLMDPERNVVLAHRFLFDFLYRIVEDLQIDDSGFNRIIDGDEFEISKIKGEHRFTEIPAGKDKKQRIDHALELKVGHTRRVLVFEYKFNGVLQNDLKAYQETIEELYEGTKVKFHYFILELGSKNHNLTNKGDFKFIAKNTLVEAVRETLDVARQKDMLATKLYLEQYLEIIEPKVKDEFLFSGLEKQLWHSWNPAMDDYDDANDVFDSLVEEHIEDENHQIALIGFYYGELFNRRVISALEDHYGQIDTKLNQGWLRILPRCPYKDLYLWTMLLEHEGDLYLTINFYSSQDPKAQLEKVELQKAYTIRTLSRSLLAEPLQSITDLNSFREIWIDQNLDVVKKISCKEGLKYPHNFKVCYLRKIDINALENICTFQDSEEFDLMIEELTGFIDLISQTN